MVVPVAYCFTGSEGPGVRIAPGPISGFSAAAFGQGAHNTTQIADFV